MLVDEETGGVLLECGAVCAYAPLSLFVAIQSSQSGAYAQTAPRSKYVVTRPENEVADRVAFGYFGSVGPRPGDLVTRI